MLRSSFRQFWSLLICFILLLAPACSAAPSAVPTVVEPAVATATTLPSEPSQTPIPPTVVLQPTTTPTQPEPTAAPTLEPTATPVPVQHIAARLGGRAEDELSVIIPWQDGWAMAGLTDSFGAGLDDLWLVRMSTEGAIQWQLTLGGSNYEYVDALLATSDGDLLVVASTQSFGRGDWDAWVLRLSPEGEVRWQKTLGGRYYDDLMNAQETPDGHFVLVGAHTRTGEEISADGWILELDANGSLVWQTVWNGPGFERLWTLQPAKDGGWLAAGSFGNPGEGWIAMFDSHGQMLWQKVYGGNKEDTFTHSIRTADGGYLLGGYTESTGAGEDDIWLMKLDTNGEMLWQNVYGHIQAEFLSSLFEQPDGSLALAGIWHGEASSDLMIANLSADGNLLWHSLFNDKESLNFQIALAPTASGYLMVGQTNGFKAEEYDALIMEMDSQGRCAACPSFSHTEPPILSAPDELTLLEGKTKKTDSLAVVLDSKIVSKSAKAMKASVLCKQAAVPGLRGETAAEASRPTPTSGNPSGLLPGEAQEPGSPESWVVRLVPGSGSKELIVRDLLPDGDAGGMFLAGSVRARGQDVWLARMTEDGSLTWQKNYGSGDDEVYQAAVKTPNGLAVAALGRDQVHILQVDEQGELAWQAALPLIDPSRYAGASLAALAEGDLLVTWVTGRMGLHTARLNGSGELLWQRDYSTTIESGVITWNWNSIQSIIMANGDVVLALLGDYDLEFHSLLLLRLTPDGEEVWRQYFKLPVEWMQEFRMSAMPNGGLSFGAGRPAEFAVAVQPWVARMGDDGKVSWWKTFGEDGESGALYALEQGHLVGGGYFDGAWLAMLKGDGEISWRTSLVLSRAFYPSDVLPVPGGYLLAGSSEIGSSAFSWVIKFDETGAIPACTTEAIAGPPMQLLGLNLRDKSAYLPVLTEGEGSLRESDLAAASLDLQQYWSCAVAP